MSLLSLQNVSLNLGGKDLLKRVNLTIEQGERVCLVGRNGVGKSSLMTVLAEKIRPDSGEVVRSHALPFGYMEQNVPDHWTGPVFGVVASGLGNVGRELAAAHLVATGRESMLSPQDRALAARLNETGEGWERYGDVLSVINQLGLNAEADFLTLSGGSRRRVALARALLGSENLLLDEPTNHLDIRTINWLEDFLVRRISTLVFVSHDRAFARRLATRVVELDRGCLYSYACTWDRFQERREQRLENEERDAAAFDRKLAKEEVWIRQGIKARRTRNMGRVRALEAMREERRARVARMGTATMTVQEAEISGKMVVEARHVGYMYPDGYRVFEDFSTIIRRGDRVGLIGDNGAGKTTLLRVLLGELQPTEGKIRQGTRLEVCYFDQLRATLDPEKSVMYNVAEGNDTVTINGQQRHIASWLSDFLFEPSRMRVPVHTLSGGERNRLLLAKLFTQPSNVLVLDEPTNDLDMETLELLEDVLADYSGTVLIVSHDREFLDNIVTSTLALEGDGRVHEYVGGYTDWLRQRPEPEKTARTAAVPAVENVAARKSADFAGDVRALKRARKLSFKEQRELEQLRLELEGLPDRAAALEAEQSRLEQALADPDFFGRDPEGFASAAKRLESVEAEQVALLERWEFVEGRAAELQERE